ncbi:MAG: hypothetical protein COB65_00935 [Thalassobium sp.]|nr:MAG: hypothetical protein COB65_00935 [Thalassobium sp.]
MDCKELLGGQNWDYEIRIALDRADIVVVFISSNSVNKRGYAQREIKLAIDKYDEKLISDIYIIPVQLDEGDFPHLLTGIQFIRVADGGADEALKASIAAATKDAVTQNEIAQADAEVSWQINESRSEYDGIPGFAITVPKIVLTSSKYSGVSEIAGHINGRMIEFGMNARTGALNPQPDFFNLMQDKWRRTNTFDAVFETATVVGRVFSAKFSMHWYSAGAAHPVHSPQTFNYLLEPVCQLATAESLFGSNDDALNTLQLCVEEGLIETLYSSGATESDVKWIRQGTKDWSDFKHFSLTSEGISIQFSSYQVCCYASGMPAALVPFEKVRAYFTEPVLHALNLYR